MRDDMRRRAFIGSGIAVAGSTVLSRTASAQQTPVPVKVHLSKPTPPANPFLREGNWYKAALHVHTKTSDGDVDVVTRLKQYREAGFQVVAVTDHGKTNDLTGLSDGGFLAINSMEAHPKTGTGAPGHHFVCLDLPHPFKQEKGLSAQQLIDAVKLAGGKVIYAHPYWTAHALEEMLEVSGYIGVEVYNANCDLASGKGYSQSQIDQLFNKGLLVGLTAVDDIHKSAWIGRGWTMVRAKELTKGAVMAAIAAGHTYASCGPVIEDFRIEVGTVKLTCSPVAQIRFYFDGAGGGRLYGAESGQTLCEAKWAFGGGRKPPQWIRAEVTDKDGKLAWTNPLAV